MSSQNCIDIFLIIIRYYLYESNFLLPIYVPKKLLMNIIKKSTKINDDLLADYINHKVYAYLIEHSLIVKQPLKNFVTYNIIIKKLT